jgi:phospholipid/cholesterol/gamma-HCH transport system ATP-binding protein
MLLQIKNLYKSFGEKKVHSGVEFQVQEGEMLGLFGTSGTGKSLILRSIIGLETPDAGEIIFEGKNILGLNERELIPVRKKIGYVFQNGALFDSLTVEENLSYPLQEHTSLSPPEILDKVNDLLEKLDLKGLNDLLPNALSGGMQKRVGLARVLILGPKIILFDEPTAGLDPSNTKRLINIIKNLKKTGMTGIFVTHDIPSAYAITDRIAILHEGKIRTLDTTEKIQNSQDTFVQKFTKNSA